MAALGQRGLPVPRAVDHNRHAVLMSLVDAYPLTQVTCMSTCLEICSHRSGADSGVFWQLCKSPLPVRRAAGSRQWPSIKRNNWK